ncbi:AMP-dependent synthetase [Egibacter rhizosphaerae]|uniref:AMP-dependent synthetase n=1 Tax=Egibacter rhizosphaerae TaxID=1670831 RepID=A0A411YLH5_9ACTN|nr:AMP-dependent synthetase [Egibacter rhizosphaerae]
MARPGPALLPTVDAVWARGAAVLPIDPELAPPARDRLLATLRPRAVVEPPAAGTRPFAPPTPADVASSATIEWRAEAEPVPRGTALVVATSGSSGAPKGVRLSHRALRASVTAGLARLDSRPDDVWLACLPPHHVAGLLVLLRARALGAPVRIVAPFDPGEIARAPELARAPDVDPGEVARAPANRVALVPTMLSRLLDAGVDLSGYRTVLLGGAALPGEVRERAVAAGAPLVESYGMSETAGGCVYDGRPLDGVRVALDDTGRIHVTGPVLSDGYHLDPARTAEAFADGWFATGDRGRWDGDRLVVEGRLDAAVTTGGETVDVEAVAACLAAHPGIADAAAGGLPDPEWGERLVAWCVPTHRDLPTLEELRRHAAERLGRAAAPRDVVAVDAIPRTPLGKVRRDALPGPSGLDGTGRCAEPRAPR